MTFPAESTFAPWQIPSTMSGSFRLNNEERTFNAHLVNIDAKNTKFFVRLFVNGSLVPFDSSHRIRPLVAGSGESADMVAVENAIDMWTCKGANELTFYIDD